MPEEQIVGDQKQLGQSPTSPPTSTSVMPTAQLVGDTVGLNRNPLHSPSANPPSGQTQIIGDACDLNRAAVKGNRGQMTQLSMNQRVPTQSDNAAERGGRGRR